MFLPLLRAAGWRVLVCVVVMAFPLGSHAARDFDRYLSSAVSLYENLEYERALEQLGRAKRLASGIDQDIAVALHEGLIYADMGMRDEALAAFQTALSLDVEAKLPLPASPKVARDFESVRSLVRKDLARREKTSPDPRGGTGPGKQRAEQGSASPAPRSSESQPPLVVGGTDRPERTQGTEGTLTPSPRASEVFSPSVETRSVSRVPVVSAALLGAGVVAAGVGTFLGVSSRGDVSSAREAEFQSDASAQLEDARSSARAANILFGAAGLAVTGALVSWLLSSSDEASTPMAGASR